MTLVLEIKPEMESRLHEEAAKQGVDAATYVSALLEERLKLQDDSEGPRERSLLELEGLGAEMWQGIDAQEYVNELRKEWDHRP